MGPCATSRLCPPTRNRVAAEHMGIVAGGPRTPRGKLKLARAVGQVASKEADKGDGGGGETDWRYNALRMLSKGAPPEVTEINNLLMAAAKDVVSAEGSYMLFLDDIKQRLLYRPGSAKDADDFNEIDLGTGNMGGDGIAGKVAVSGSSMKADDTRWAPLSLPLPAKVAPPCIFLLRLIAKRRCPVRLSCLQSDLGDGRERAVLRAERLAGQQLHCGAVQDTRRESCRRHPSHQQPVRRGIQVPSALAPCPRQSGRRPLTAFGAVRSDEDMVELQRLADSVAALVRKHASAVVFAQLSEDDGEDGQLRGMLSGAFSPFWGSRSDIIMSEACGRHAVVQISARTASRSRG